uniref:Large ribosomal subunit protein bL21c n=1 Tax=Nitella hyalina TaxID=181804 RepID=A0A2H4G3I3_NITHY|nr:ribosomal protein L21 [Nitella hyalina]APP89508.1 ribosomal protein L21 [Nitella hyalina]WKT08470.1 ribosomal protein L21 [Nitella hyalina]
MNTNTYAIIETGGHQLRVEAGRFYDTRHFSVLKPDTKILIYRVAMIHFQSQLIIGKPWLANAIVKARIIHSYNEKKIRVYKMHSKKKTRKKQGHRQKITRFMVDAIFLNGRNLSL